MQKVRACVATPPSDARGSPRLCVRGKSPERASAVRLARLVRGAFRCMPGCRGVRNVRAVGANQRPSESRRVVSRSTIVSFTSAQFNTRNVKIPVTADEKLLARAQELMRNEQWKPAFTIVSAVLDRDPRCFRALLLRAEILKNLLLFADALKDIDAAKALQPRHWEVHYVRALVNAAKRDLNQALVDVETAKALNPTALEPWALHADILFKISSREALAQLVHVCDSVVQNSQTKDAGMLRALMQRGLAYMRLGRYARVPCTGAKCAQTYVWARVPEGTRGYTGHPARWGAAAWVGRREACGMRVVEWLTRYGGAGPRGRRTTWRRRRRSGRSTRLPRSSSSSACCS